MSPPRLPWDDRLLAAMQGAAKVVCWALVATALLLVVFAERMQQRLGRDGVVFGLSLENALQLTGLALVAGAIWLFAQGRKRRVLFLRKFGHQPANRAVGAAIRRGLGHCARLFVLDDSRFRAVRLPWSDRLQAVLVALPFALFAALLGHVRVSDGPVRTGSAAAPARWVDSPWTDLPGAFFLWLWAAAAVLPLLASIGVALRRAQRVVSVADFARLARRVAHAGTWFAAPRQMAPMMTLVRTDDAIWQQTVELLVQGSDLIVFDLSVGSEALRWEIDTCLRLAPERTLFVAVAQDAGDWHGLPKVLTLPAGQPHQVARALAAEVMAWPAFGIRQRLGLGGPAQTARAAPVHLPLG